MDDNKSSRNVLKTFRRGKLKAEIMEVQGRDSSFLKANFPYAEYESDGEMRRSHSGLLTDTLAAISLLEEMVEYLSFNKEGLLPDSDSAESDKGASTAKKK